MTTKWVGEAWERLKKQKGLIKHSFKKYSLSNNLAVSDNALINIKGIEEYKMHFYEKEFQMIEEIDSGDDDDDDDDDDDGFEESIS